MSFGGNESKKDLGQLRDLTQTNTKVFLRFLLCLINIYWMQNKLKLRINYSLKSLRYRGGGKNGLAMTRATCYAKCLQGRRLPKGGGE
jgi:hypothetical protein